MSNNNEELIPKGEDQYLFGKQDAELLEMKMKGLGTSYFSLLIKIKEYTSDEYVKGFVSFYK